ncbi:MAG TPA: neutral zinc metallopeptidase [Candidatus Binatia bacterium]|jgi:predicted metalloprotease|nr:neutral zinc metallopeptidase [Candidatus Binatia bacterium]
MRWTPGQRSENLEDRRGSVMRRGIPIGIGGVLVLGLLSILTGRDFLTPILSDPSLQQTAPEEQGQLQTTPQEEKQVDFVSFVLDDAQGTWNKLLPDRYQPAKLVLFRDAVQSACGFAQSATGPFYCPGDQKVYVDLGFYDELTQRFGAPGDFAQAYVLAHEIGHHVQNVLGIERQVRALQQQRPELRNELSVRLELQADCYAGVWGFAADQRDVLEPGDIAEGLRAASAIGDDRIQRMQTGTVQPESFTHGSSAQRVEWLQKGLRSGDPKACDTFADAG